MMNQFGAGRLLKREQTCSLSLPAPSSGTEISEEYCQYSFESDLDLTMFFSLVHLEFSMKHRFTSTTDQCLLYQLSYGAYSGATVFSRKTWSRSTNHVL